MLGILLHVMKTFEGYSGGTSLVSRRPVLVVSDVFEGSHKLKIWPDIVPIFSKSQRSDPFHCSADSFENGICHDHTEGCRNAVTEFVNVGNTGEQN